MVTPQSGVHHGPMRAAHPTPGFTLIEMVLVLLLLGVMLTVTLPPFARWRDAAAVHAARDELAAGLAWARVAAYSRNGATLVLDAAEGRFWTLATGEADTPATDLRARYGVRVEAGSAGTVLFHYDALGIGRLSSRTVRIQRRGAEAGLTVSAYGRVRRW